MHTPQTPRRAAGASARTLALSAAALLGAALLVSPAHASAPDLQLRMKQTVAAGAPGVVALVDDGSGPRIAARGMADLRTQRPMRPHQRFRIGSVTKSFVATVALQLVDEGRMSLSDTVESRLPGLLPYGERVTLRQLLNHTSGVPEFAIRTRERLYRGRRFQSWTPRRLVALIAGERQQFPAGSRFAYTNTNYALAGMMIEQATGQRLGGEIRRRILRPLGLRDTSFPLHRASLPGPSMRGYSLAHDRQGHPVAGKLHDYTVYDPSAIWAGGNMVSDLDDLARFYEALLGGRLLPPALLSEMKADGEPWVAGQRYGLGLHVIDTPCGPVFGHTGGVPGFSTFAFAGEDGTRQAGVIMNAEDAAPRAVERFNQVAEQSVQDALC